VGGLTKSLFAANMGSRKGHERTCQTIPAKCQLTERSKRKSLEINGQEKKKEKGSGACAALMRGCPKRPGWRKGAWDAGKENI